MEGEEGGGIRLSKRFSDKAKEGEVDYKTKAGTAWSHSYLNQKPWHPLSYPNQRRKWIAEQTHANRQRRSEEVAREYAQEQEFFRQTNLISKEEKEKVELMQAVSFMYVRLPGYNAKSAKAAELADEKKKEELSNPNADGPSPSMPPEPVPEERKKQRPKDVFGRPLPTEEEFEILKNAPRTSLYLWTWWSMLHLKILTVSEMIEVERSEKGIVLQLKVLTIPGMIGVKIADRDLLIHLRIKRSSHKHSLTGHHDPQKHHRNYESRHLHH